MDKKLLNFRKTFPGFNETLETDFSDGHAFDKDQLFDLRGRLGQLRAAAKRAASDMERAAVLIGGNYLGTGYAQSLNERADELRAAINRSEA